MRTPRGFEVTVTIEDEDDVEIEVDCEGTYAVPAKGWDPGDSGELDVVRAVDANGVDRMKDVRREDFLWSQVESAVETKMGPEADDDDGDRRYDAFRDRDI
jgi:hypothetical protein